MALSGAIGQATSGNDNSYYTVASHTGKGVITSIFVKYSGAYDPGTSGSGTITVRIIIDGNTYYIDVGRISYQASTATLELWEAGLALKNIKLPYSSSMSIAVKSAGIDTGKFAIQGNAFYIKEV